MLVRRKTRPTRVTRGSFLAACLINSLLFSKTFIERNFNTQIGSLSYPCRSWRKKTGPGEASFTAIAAIRKSGESNVSPMIAADMSNTLLTAWSTMVSGGRATGIVVILPKSRICDVEKKASPSDGTICRPKGSSDRRLTETHRSGRVITIGQNEDILYVQ